MLRRTRFVLPFLGLASAFVLPACSGEVSSVSDAQETASEVQSRRVVTIEGRFEAGGPTDFQIAEKIGPEDTTVTAVDLGRLELPGRLLVGKTLRIRGSLERREVSRLPNGTKISNDVLVARQIIERENREVTFVGTLSAAARDTSSSNGCRRTRFPSTKT
jgi:hypothetical protein